MAVDQLGLVGPDSRQRLNELADGLSNPRQWAVFIGAGLSQGAGVAGWGRLVAECGKRFGVEGASAANQFSFPFLLQKCEQAAETPTQFWDFVRERICLERDPTYAQKQILRLPFALFVTPNLDCLLEGLHKELDVLPPRSIAYPDLRPGEMSGQRLVYLHGRCPCVDDEPPFDADSAILTDEAYRREYASDTPVYLSLAALLVTYRVLFLGTSLNEPPFYWLLNMASRLADSRQLPPARNLALVPTSDTNVSDAAWGAVGYGVLPIWYHDPPGADHQALDGIIDFLAKRKTDEEIELGD